MNISKTTSVAALALLAVTLGACKHNDGAQVAGWTLVDPTQRHPILVSQEPATLHLNVAEGSTRLSPVQRADVLDFSAKYRAADAGNSRLVISAPSGSANEVAAMAVVHDLKGVLTNNGFSQSDISVEAYQSDDNSEGTVKISYLRYVAQGPECGHWGTNLARQPDNMNFPNLGCATQRNFAAQIANPADLLGPRSETARGAERRTVAWEKYIAGDVTTAKKTKDERVDTRASE
jgi:pilus assembly protein CpaD